MAIFDPSTLGVADNQITFNDYNNSPIYRVKRRMPSKREIREFDIPIPEESGVADFQTFIGKSYFILEGVMYPNNETEFYQGREALQKLSSLVVSQADPSTDFGYVPYAWTQPNGTRQMFVKVEYIDIPEDGQQGIVQPFRIICKVKTPVIYSGTTISGVIGVTTPPISSGNSGLSFPLPVLLGANTYTYNGTFTNDGTMPTFPVFNITGPCNHPRITNVTTGEYIQVNQNLGAGDTLNITYDDDTETVTLNGNSVYSSVAYGSTFFKLPPGAHSFTFTADSLSPGAQAAVSFYSAWPVS